MNDNVSLTDIECALDSEAIGAAAAMRDDPASIAPQRLFDLAKTDARNLLNAWRGDAKAGRALTVSLQLDEKGLQSSIFRHAMIHAGGFIDASAQKPYDHCPRCGSELKWPGN